MYFIYTRIRVNYKATAEIFFSLSFNPLKPDPSSLKLLHIVAYKSNPPFVISDIRALWRSAQSARVPECQKLQMVC